MCDCVGENKDTLKSLHCVLAPVCAEELLFSNRRVGAVALFPCLFWKYKRILTGLQPGSRPASGGGEREALRAPPCLPRGPESPSGGGQGPVEAPGPCAGPAASPGFKPFHLIHFCTSLRSYTQTFILQTICVTLAFSQLRCV